MRDAGERGKAAGQLEEAPLGIKSKLPARVVNQLWSLTRGRPSRVTDAAVRGPADVVVRDSDDPARVFTSRGRPLRGEELLGPAATQWPALPPERATSAPPAAERRAAPERPHFSSHHRPATLHLSVQSSLVCVIWSRIKGLSCSSVCLYSDPSSGDEDLN